MDSRTYIEKIQEERGYLDLEHWREACRLAWLDGRKEIYSLAEEYPNDEELGAHIRKVYINRYMND